MTSCSSISSSSSNPFHPIFDDHGDSVHVGGVKKLNHSPDGIMISDDEEAISAIVNAISAETGKKITDCKDIKITSSFTEVGDGSGKIKAMSYKDPNMGAKAPNCFYFERVWTVKVADKDGIEQTIVLKKNIYTNIVIPINSDKDLFNDRVMMAGLAAGTYANFINDAVLVSAEMSKKYPIDQITKVQKDQFLTMSLYHNKKKVTPNKMKHGEGKVITGVNIKFRAGKKGAKDEAEFDANDFQNLAKKINNSSIKTFGQIERERKYLLVTEGDSEKPRHIEEEALVQAILNQGEDIEDAPRHLHPKIEEQLRTENTRLQRKFDDRLDLFSNPKRLSTVTKLYSRGSLPEVSDNLLQHLNKQKSFKSKKPLAVIKTLIHEQNITRNPALDKEIRTLLTHLDKALIDLEKYHKEMTTNEKNLAFINSDDHEEIIEAREARQKILNELYELTLKIEPLRDESPEQEKDVDKKRALGKTQKNLANRASQKPEELPWIDLRKGRNPDDDLLDEDSIDFEADTEKTKNE